MATFNLGNAGDISLINDWSKIQSYLYKLNEQLRYMFNNLTPDDNYSEEARLIYVADGEKQAAIEVSLDNISLSMVKKDEVVSAINLSEEGVKIHGDKISMEGVVTVNSYFKIGLDGSMEATNGSFSGDITASNISGSTLTAGGSQDGVISVLNNSGTEIGRWDKNGININGGSISSAAINLGGSGNQGKMEIYNASGTKIGSWDNSGIDIRKGTLEVGQFYTDANYTQIGGFYCSEAYGREMFCSNNEETGMSSNPGFTGGLWFWAGWDGDEGYDFLVNNGGQVWANDFGSWTERETFSGLVSRVKALEDAVGI